MKCPKCQKNFPPLKVVLITRWSSLICPECKARWNRRLDLQLFLVGMVPLIVILFATFLPVDFHVKTLHILALGVITLVLVSFVDAATIRLVPAEKQVGWRKILGDKLAPSALVTTKK